MTDGSFEKRVREFLGKKRIAIWGVETGKPAPGEWVARKLGKRGAEVIAVNPAFADDPAADRASSLTRIDPPVEAVLLYVDPPQVTEAVEDCIAARVPFVWLHDAMSPGAATAEAIERLRGAGAIVIPGLCPMLYLKPADPAHFCLRWVLRMKGKEQRVRSETL